MGFDKVIVQSFSSSWLIPKTKCIINIVVVSSGLEHSTLLFSMILAMKFYRKTQLVEIS